MYEATGPPPSPLLVDPVTPLEWAGLPVRSADGLRVADDVDFAFVGPPDDDEDESIVVQRGEVPAGSDPDSYGRGLVAHRQIANQLRAHVRRQGWTLLPRPVSEPHYDLAWRTVQEIWLVEIKSLQPANETHQLRLGLGQILHYAGIARELQQAGRVPGDHRIRAALVVEHAPTAAVWGPVAEEAGVCLSWLGGFDRLAGCADH
jgi:hypothetical protein